MHCLGSLAHGIAWGKAFKVGKDIPVITHSKGKQRHNNVPLDHGETEMSKETPQAPRSGA